MSHPISSASISPSPLSCYEEPEPLVCTAPPEPDPDCDQMSHAAEGAQGAPADLPEDACDEPAQQGPDCTGELLKTAATCGAAVLSKVPIMTVLAGIGCVGQAIDTYECLTAEPR